MVRLRFVRHLVAPALAIATLRCGSGDLLLPGDTEPTQIEIIQGDEQTGSAGLPLEDSIVVRVLDGGGRAMTGLQVAFSLADGAAGGDVSPDTVVTDGRGESAALWVLGGAAGAQSLDAKVVGRDLTVRVTASAGSSGPSRLVAVSGDAQTAPVGTALTDSLVVQVLDGFDNPVAGITVDWSASEGDVSPTSVVTGADGRAATRRILGSAAGTQTATADAPGLTGSPLTFTHTAVPGTAASLVLISGSDQRGETGQELPEPLVVRLVDEAGNGIPGRAVSWVVATGGGSVTPTTTTDDEGFASATWTLGPSPGSNTLNAVVSGVGVVRFVANGTGGGGGGGGSEPSGSRSTVSADPESIQAGIGTSTISVTVLNGSGAPVEGATVTLAASGSGNTLAQPGEPTGANGVATGTLRSTVPGTKVVRATVNGNVQINQTAEVTVLVAAATQVELLEGDDQTAQVGEEVDVQPAVRVTNALGQPVPGFGVTFVVTEGNGDVSGATQSTNSDGVARVGGWTLGAEGTNTLEARAGSLQGSPVVFTANGVPTNRLVFLVQPSDVVEDTPFSPVVTVAIVDGGGNVVDVDGITIDIDLFRDDGHESNELEGDTFQVTDDGIAVFPGLQVDRDEQDMRLRASSPDLPGLGEVFSNSFDVEDD